MPKSRVRRSAKTKKAGAGSSSGAIVPNRPTDWEQQLYGYLLRDSVPAELLPLYAVLVAVTHRVTMANAATCVPTCATLAATLTGLGMPAEPIAAKADLHHIDAGGIGERIETVGSSLPRVRSDGTTNGHMVVYARTLRRIVDPTIVQARFLLNRTRRDPVAMMPAILPLPDHLADEALYQQQYAAARDGYAIVYTLQPEYTAALLDIVDSNRVKVLSGPAATVSAAVLQNTAELTTTAVDIIKTVASARGITSEVAAAHPSLAIEMIPPNRR